MTKQKHKILKSIGAAALLLALIATPIGLKLSSVSAAANEIATVNFTTMATKSTAVNDSFTFIVPVGGDIVEGDKIVVRIPDNFPASYAAGAVSMTTDGTLDDEAYAWNSLDREASATLGVGDAIGAGDTITVAFANDFITAPATEGQYSFSIRLDDADDVVLATGAALLQVDNQVSVTTTVQEALVLTIDGLQINLNVDPAVNAGKDYSQKTTLNAKTNAQSGYVIQGKLKNSTTANAELYNTDASAGLASGDALSTENRFGYVAYNADTTKTQAELDAEAAAQAFAASGTNLVTYAGGANYVENTAPTNSQDHTVYYVINVDFLTPAGTYEGTVTYTAVPSF